MPTTKSKVLSASLGSGSTSAKYLPTNKTVISTSTGTPSSQTSSKTQCIDKPELGKKYSHEKLRTTTTIQTTTYSKLGDINDSKKYEKPVLKYVRSNKDIIKTTEAIHAPYKKFTDHHPHKVETETHSK